MWIWVWVGVIIFSIVFETMTFDLVGIWFIPGAILSFVLACFGTNWIIQVVLFFTFSLLLMALLRRFLVKLLKKDKEKTNTDLIIGKKLKLITAIKFQQPGSVKINDVIWSASLSDETMELDADSLVEVIEIKGNKLIVKEVK